MKDNIHFLEDGYYVEQLEKENQRLKENNMSMQEEMARTWEKADLYKEVIDEVREYIEKNLFEEDNGCGCYWQQFGDYDDAKSELLQILDKAKEVNKCKT